MGQETKDKDLQKVITGKCRLCFVHVLEPHSVSEDGDKKYSVCVLVDKDDADTIADLKNGIRAAIAKGKEKYGKAFDNPKRLKLPLRDGDEERENDATYENKYFFNCSAKLDRQPVVVARDGKTVLTSKNEVYSGMYARVSIRFYPFAVSGNAGVAVGLNNLMKVAEGERLSGGSSAQADFAEYAEGEDLGAESFGKEEEDFDIF